MRPEIIISSGKIDSVTYASSDLIFPGIGTAPSSSFTADIAELLQPDLLRGILLGQGLDPFTVNSTGSIDLALTVLVFGPI